MKEYKVLVKETKITEYTVDAETKQEAKDFYLAGYIKDSKLIDTRDVRIMEVME